VGHPFRIREIAVQAGLSEATVDRVLHHRPGVRASTAREVHQAIADLERQRTQVRLGGRTFVIDLVMQAPRRFSSAVRSALEAEQPTLRPAVIRTRFHFQETGPLDWLLDTLDGVVARGSHGVLLKAPDVPEVTAAVSALAAKRIPVVTLVTDLPSSQRLAYVGIDNRAAGATAAYLIGQWLGERPGNILVTLSRSSFRGEEEREMGFRAALRAMSPPRALVDITETDGLDETMRDLVRTTLSRDPDIAAVYSIGGGNSAIVATFDEVRRDYAVFIAHDLDEDNSRLLRDGRVSAVLHHDLNQDTRRACHIIMQANGALPGGVFAWPSAIQIITPHNIPMPIPHSG
jgi:LacI family transcriptional regulator